MADEFIISDKIRELATKLGEPDLEGEVDKFLNHHEATGWKRKGGIKIVNKEAALRTWLGNAKTYRDERNRQLDADWTKYVPPDLRPGHRLFVDPAKKAARRAQGLKANATRRANKDRNSHRAGV